MTRRPLRPLTAYEIDTLLGLIGDVDPAHFENYPAREQTRRVAAADRGVAKLRGMPEEHDPAETADAREAIDEAALDALAEADRLRGCLQVVTDALAELLNEERFPPRGRSTDDRDATFGWWEDRIEWVRSAYSALAGVDDLTWRLAHPGLFIPPAGKIDPPPR
jgi:hypothetical protein